jgi:transcriptional regulator with XRE-family HTH domain
MREVQTPPRRKEVNLMADGARPVQQRRLARMLRRLREDAGRTIEEVATQLDLSPSTLSRIETAQVRVRTSDLRQLLEIYKVTEAQREQLLQLARERRQQPWWNEYKGFLPVALASLERGTAAILQYSVQLVPGLLQTEAYARELLKALPPIQDLDIKRRVEFRMKRQELLTDDQAPRLWVVLDEAVLRRPIGGQQVMAEQLQRLIDAAALPKVTIQVLPFRAGVHAGMDGEFTILSYDDPADPDVVYLETAAGEKFDESTDVTRRYNSIFDELRAAALNPAESLRTLANVLQEQRRNHAS